LRTFDAGASWTLVSGVPAGTMTSLRIMSPFSAHLVLIGQLQYGGIYRSIVNRLETNDAGLTWQISPDTLKLNLFNGVLSADFPTHDTGFVSIEFHKLARTTDGGASWDTVSYELYPGRIHFLNGRSGFSLQSEIGGVSYSYGGIVSQIWKTNDRGMTWHIKTEQSSTAHFFNIEFPSAEVGYAIGGYNNYVEILKTTDGGAHWSRPMNDVLDDSYLTASFFQNKDTGYIADGNGKLFKTTNGGVTWSNLLTIEHFTATSIFFRNADTGYVTSYESKESKSGYAIRSTTDGGIHWIPLALAFASSYASIVFPSPDTGFLIGESNYKSSIYRSTDHGVTWKKITDSYDAYITKLQFFNASFGYALCDYGVLFKTLDGGNTWSYNSIEGNNLYDMSFLNPDTGYIVGDFGQIFRTSDGGNSWSKQESGTHFLLRSVCFASPEKVFAAGDFSVILSADNMPGLGVDEHRPKEAYLASRYYPNPARDNLSVSFALPMSGNVMIKIYDTWGRQIQCFFYKEMSAGRHVVHLNMASLTPGLYYCSILSDGICETRKVIVRE
jgi:photosystem II stability/assembly factor-like uncharacterized protein